GLSGLPFNGMVELRILDDRFAMLAAEQARYLMSNVGDEGVVIHLEPAGSISGRAFTAADNKPVANLLIRATGLPDTSTQDLSEQARTDAAGNYRFAQL